MGIAIVIAFVFSFTSASSVPFQVCKRSDANFNNCLKDAINGALQLLENGLPRYGIESIQPIKMGSWEAPGSPPLAFTQQFQNARVYNFPFSTIENLTLHLDERNFSLEMFGHNQAIVARMSYKFDNAIVDGDDLSSQGFLSYSYWDIDLWVQLVGSVIESEGTKIINITDSDMTLTRIKDFGVEILSNETERAKRLTKFVVDNTEYVLETDKRGYEIGYANSFKTIANQIFQRFGVDVLFPQ
ncbi:hypothetical protein PPYR_07793 [Photinus pyralis]|uniref:Uncharacterized protein n=1 Tax=Photinus pyralis TaxID=7054 RepID=A0A5N4ARL1_PHOPY|nr:uncharacterized protein LOC116169619 [Photinus pyralis]KAB0799913.1 hypothetical protein PPYR_07793 [Photinus pyralis]